MEPTSSVRSASLLKDIQERLDSLELITESFEDSVDMKDELEGRIDDLENKFDDLENKIDDLENKIEELEN